MSEPTPKDPRGPTNLRIKFRSASLDQFIERYAVDVSRGGIFIRTREPLAVGTRLKLEFQLQDAAPLLAGEGTVVWIREHDPARENVTPGMGVRFDKLTPESQPTLEKILAEKTRLEQAGGRGDRAGQGGGMAVRRPSGVFASLDTNARAVLGAAAGAEPGLRRPRPRGPSRRRSPFHPRPPSRRRGRPADPEDQLPRDRARARRPRPPRRAVGPFTRARATTTRPVPVPSALFEPPTAADIDRALEALAEVPGPTPAARPTPSVPRYVADDASNEPTRVGDVVDELVGAAADARAACAGSAPMTERLAGTRGRRRAAGWRPRTASAAVARRAPRRGRRRRRRAGGPRTAGGGAGAGRARSEQAVPRRLARLPTLNRAQAGPTSFVVVRSSSRPAAGAAVKLHLTDRLFRAPRPAGAGRGDAARATAVRGGDAGGEPAAQPAAPEKAAPEGAGGSGAVAAAPTPQPAAPEKAAAEQAPEQAGGKDRRRGRTRRRRRRPRRPRTRSTPASATRSSRHAEAEGGQADRQRPPPRQPPPRKRSRPREPAAEKPPAEKAGRRAAGRRRSRGGDVGRQAGRRAAAAAPPAPVLKITSSPSGAQVLIDGKEVGHDAVPEQGDRSGRRRTRSPSRRTATRRASGW